MPSSRSSCIGCGDEGSSRSFRFLVVEAGSVGNTSGKVEQAPGSNPGRDFRFSEFSDFGSICHLWRDTVRSSIASGNLHSEFAQQH